MSSAYLPKNRTAFEQAVADAAAFREIDPDVIRTLYDVDECPPDFLPYLGWAFAVDFWELAADEDQRRELIRNSITWHQKRGTPWAIKAALAAFGYPVVELIEQQQYLRDWIAAGGWLLDGSRLNDGALQLNAPVLGVGRQVSLQHWAEYAIRLDAAAGIWTREHQRKIRRVAESFAPERSHLVRLIASLGFGFHAPILIGVPATRLRVSLSCCRRFKVFDRQLLDGCSKLSGDFAPEHLTGVSLLNGALRLTGLRPTGELLAKGQLTFTPSLRVSLAMQMGGRSLEPLLRLGQVWTALDGRLPLHGPLLRGGAMSEGWHLGDNRLGRVFIPRLDGTRLLGGQRGQPGLHFDGVVRIRGAGFTTQERFMSSSSSTTPVTHAYRNHVAKAALQGGTISRAAFMAFSESDVPYSPEQDLDLPGEFARLPITGVVEGANLKVFCTLPGELAGDRTVRGVAVFTESGLLMGRRVLKPKELEPETSMDIDITFTF